jgi:hypothetical protein
MGVAVLFVEFCEGGSECSGIGAVLCAELLLLCFEGRPFVSGGVLHGTGPLEALRLGATDCASLQCSPKSFAAEFQLCDRHLEQFGAVLEPIF